LGDSSSTGKYEKRGEKRVLVSQKKRKEKNISDDTATLSQLINPHREGSRCMFAGHEDELI